MAPAFRGSIYWHDYGPVIGAELSGHRPALVISNDTINRKVHTTITLPTSTAQPNGRFRRQHILLGETSAYASARQVKSVQQKDLQNQIGQASPQEMQEAITSITNRLLTEHSTGQIQTPGGTYPMAKGTMWTLSSQSDQPEPPSPILVLDYNAANRMAVAADLEFTSGRQNSPVAIPIKTQNNDRPAVALLHRIRSLDTSQRRLTHLGTAAPAGVQSAIDRLIQLIAD